MIYDFPSTELSRSIAEKYGYDDFIIRRWLNFFGDEAIKIVEAFEEGLPKYIRVNTIKLSEELLLRSCGGTVLHRRHTGIPDGILLRYGQELVHTTARPRSQTGRGCGRPCSFTWWEDDLHLDVDGKSRCGHCS